MLHRISELRRGLVGKMWKWKIDGEIRATVSELYRPLNYRGAIIKSHYIISTEIEYMIKQVVLLANQQWKKYTAYYRMDSVFDEKNYE